MASRLARDVNGRLIAVDESGSWFVAIGNSCRTGERGVFFAEDEARRARQARELRLERRKRPAPVDVAGSGNGSRPHRDHTGAAFDDRYGVGDPHG